MGNKPSYIDNCIKFDRILDNEHQIYIGIGSTESTKSHQVIQFGDSKHNYYRLIYFDENENKLTYHFENQIGSDGNIIMILEKNGNDIILHISSLTPIPGIGRNIKKIMDPIIRKHFKKINFDSYEFDKIFDFIKEDADP